MAATCPECRTPIGGSSGNDPYKHFLSCLHLRPGRIADLLDQAKAGSAGYVARVKEAVAILTAEEA